jgi:hypothetical protein
MYVHTKNSDFPRGAMLLLGSLWLSNHWSFKVNQSKSNDQNDPPKSNESKAQQIPLSSFLYQILE